MYICYLNIKSEISYLFKIFDIYKKSLSNVKYYLWDFKKDKKVEGREKD